MRACVTNERSDWLAASIYGAMVGGPNNGRRRSGSRVGHLSQGPGAETGSDVIQGNPVGNPSMERTIHDAKQLTRKNTQALAVWPLINECKQKHMEGAVHGLRIWNNGGWAKKWSEGVEVMGEAPWPAGPNRNLVEPGGNHGKLTHGKGNSQSEISYCSYLPMILELSPPQHWCCTLCHLELSPHAIGVAFPGD